MTMIVPSDSQILKRLLRGYELLAPRLGPRPVVVVEGGYFDDREGEAADRIDQLRDSYRFLDQLSGLKHPPLALPTMLINDFGRRKRVLEAAATDEDCVGEACRPEMPVSASMTSDDSDRYRIPAAAAEVYESAEGKRHRAPEIFFLARARNRAARILRDTLRDGVEGSALETAARADGGVDINAIVEGTEIRLATVGPGKHLSLKCAALMAEHYFQLGTYAHEQARQLTGLLIVDFIRYNERERVQRGAETTLALYPWPMPASTWIVNCTYFEDNAGDFDPLQLTPPLRRLDR